MADSKNLLTIGMAAERLGLSVACLRAWVMRRKIGYVKVGSRRIAIPEAEIAKIIDRGYVPALPERTQ